MGAALRLRMHGGSASHPPAQPANEAHLQQRAALARQEHPVEGAQHGAGAARVGGLEGSHSPLHHVLHRPRRHLRPRQLGRVAAAAGAGALAGAAVGGRAAGAGRGPLLSGAGGRVGARRRRLAVAAGGLRLAGCLLGRRRRPGRRLRAGEPTGPLLLPLLRRLSPRFAAYGCRPLALLLLRLRLLGMLPARVTSSRLLFCSCPRLQLFPWLLLPALLLQGLSCRRRRLLLLPLARAGGAASLPRPGLRHPPPRSLRSWRHGPVLLARRPALCLLAGGRGGPWRLRILRRATLSALR